MKSYESYWENLDENLERFEWIINERDRDIEISMTVSKSTAGSCASPHLSILGTHPHPQLHHLKSSGALASVTKATVDTTATMGPGVEVEKGTVMVDGKMSKNPSSWDPQDDILLRHLKEVKKLGWKDISQYFTNRTPNACQFRWRRLKSGNLKSNRTATVDVSDYPGKAGGSGGAQEAAGSTAVAAGPVPVPVNCSFPSAIAIPPPSAARDHPVLTSAPNSASATPSVSYSRSPFSLAPTGANNNYSLGSNNGAGSKYLKARSNSHSFSLNSFTHPPSIGNGLANGVKPPADEENIGFIPKIIVRSRRSSFAQPLATPTAKTSHLTSALNTTLNTTKTRKSSFVGRSRRSSFNLSSNPTSRRSSIIVAPTSMNGSFSLATGSSTPKGPRRDSTVRTHRSASSSASSSSASFMDLPPPAIQHISRGPARVHLKLQQKAQQHLHQQKPYQSPQMPPNGNWSTEEDQLLSESGSRNLSVMELSILLPNRSEREIQWRLDILSNANSPTGSNETSESPLHSPRKSVTAEDTAIDEDTCDEADQGNDDDYDESVDPLHHSLSPPTISKENTPASIISSTTTNDDVSSMSTDHHLHSEPSNDDNKTLRSFSSQKNTSHFSSSPATTTSLPGINTILKGTL